MNKIRIAFASMFVFAAVAGMSAQSAIQAEIQKAEQTCLQESGTAKKDFKKDRKDRTECKDKSQCKGKSQCKDKSQCKKGKAQMKGRQGCGPLQVLEELNLTSQQQEQVKALCNARMEKQKASRDEAKAKKAEAKAEKREAMQAKRQADRQEFEAELQKILTPEQFATYQSRKAEQGPRMQGNRDAVKAKLSKKACKDGTSCKKDSVVLGQTKKVKTPKRR